MFTDIKEALIMRVSTTNMHYFAVKWHQSNKPEVSSVPKIFQSEGWLVRTEKK